MSFELKVANKGRYNKFKLTFTLYTLHFMLLALL
jgi:hypothetical protein